VVEHPLGEPGTDVAEVAQPAVGVVGAEQQRAQRAGPATLTGRPTTDHDLLGMEQSGLDPGRRPASRFVPGTQPFADDALQAVLARPLKQLAATNAAAATYVGVVRRYPDQRCAPVEIQARQQLRPL